MGNMKNLFLFYNIFNALLLTAQAPSIAWQKAYGGSSYDFMNQSIKTFDGGYVLSGWTYSGISGDKTTSLFGNYDFWVIKNLTYLKVCKEIYSLFYFSQTR